MERISVYCVDNEEDRVAEVLERSLTRLKVVMVGTTLTITLNRSLTEANGGRPYIGRAANMEFESFGVLEED